LYEINTPPSQWRTPSNSAVQPDFLARKAVPNPSNQNSLPAGRPRSLPFSGASPASLARRARLKVACAQGTFVRYAIEVPCPHASRIERHRKFLAGKAFTVRRHLARLARKASCSAPYEEGLPASNSPNDGHSANQNIVLSLDGQQMNTTALSAALNADGTSPFKQKAYILLNLAIGGQNGGDPSQTTFPQSYEVDYVRVFQKE
jgi:hypothetical protein